MLEETKAKPDKQEKTGKPKRDKKGRFIPGVSGNPNGRPGGMTIKERIKKIFEDNPERFEKVVDKLIEQYPTLVWQMLEGKPSQAIEIGGELPFQIIEIGKIEKKDGGK